MILILEGPDGTGKTTFANKLIEFYKSNSVRHIYIHNKHIPTSYDDAMVEADAELTLLKKAVASEEVLIMDRSFILSEYVYSQVLEREIYISESMVDALINLCMANNIIMHYFSFLHKPYCEDSSDKFLPHKDLRKAYENLFNRFSRHMYVHTSFIDTDFELTFMEQDAERITKETELAKALQQIEICGRVCYKSEDRITNSSAVQFIRRLIKSGHTSVLEHITVTLRLTTDRAIANALVRHRHTSFSQESTHYIKYGAERKYKVVLQEATKNIERWKRYITGSIELADSFEQGSSEANYIVRSLYPLGFKTELIMTTNLAEWRYIMKLRTAKGCHPQMIVLVSQIKDLFTEMLPNIVEDL